MISKLYRKLYFYALIITITAIVLTASAMELVFRAREEEHFKNNFIKEAQFISSLLDDIYLKEEDDINKALKKMNKSHRWEIEYCNNQKCTPNIINKEIPKETLDNFLLTKEAISYKVKKAPTRVLIYLDEMDISKGYLIVEFPFPKHRGDNHRPSPVKAISLASFFIILFLSILLIPYSRYILKPFRELLFSIDKVSHGDFSIIKVSPKSDFKDLATAFNNMTLKIQEMIKNRDRLIADVSHELRSPLTKIRLSLEILDKEDKGNKKYINKAINEIEQLDLLIDDLLDSSKLELNEKNNFEKVDFKKLLLEITDKNQIIFDKNNLKIELELEDKELFVNLDKKLIEKAINNIFSNTGKYAPLDSIVNIGLKDNEKNILFYVKDRGKGVKEEELEKIFDAFYRSDESRTRKTGGTGLGLSIVKKIVEIHSGKVWANTNKEFGSGLVINIELNKSI